MTTTLVSILTQLKTLAASLNWQPIETDGSYFLDYTGVDRGQRIHRRFGVLQAVFYERTGNHGDGLLDSEMAAVLGVPTEDAVRLTAAAMGINCKREEAPAHVRGKLKTALGL